MGRLSSCGSEVAGCAEAAERLAGSSMRAMSQRTEAVLPDSAPADYTLAQRLTWRVFVVGLFLTAFPLVRPVSGVGVSFGDIALLLGAVGVVMARSARGARGAARMDAAFVVFAAPGLLLIVAVLVSTIASPTATFLDASSLGIDQPQTAPV